MQPAYPAGTAPAATRSDRWLFGPGLDLWVGCGLGYIALVPVLLIYGLSNGVRAWPLAAVTALGMLINAPHYGATILRVYSNRADRAKYRFFTLHATVVLVLALAVACHNWWVASILITFYLTWSPWHFAGQNYGIALMFLRRRGVEVDATAKRLLSLSFTLSAVLAMLAIHGSAGQYSVAPPTLDTVDAPRLLPVPVPLPVMQVLVAITAVAYLVCLAAAARRLRRTGSFADRLPAWMLVGTQALWYVVPVLTLPHPEQLLPFAAVWVSTAHSAQYLWITAYYAKRSTAHEHSGRFLLKSLIAGGGVTVLPGLLFAPGVLGALSWDGGLALLIFSVVNIHHFILDGAIWKLRDQSIAGVLLRRAPEPSETPAALERGRGSGLGRLVWGAALLSLVVPLVGVHETVVISETPSAERIDVAAQRLRWIGREPAWLFELSAGRASEHDLLDDDAIAHYRRSVELRPTAAGWSALGRLYHRRQDFSAALAAYRKAAGVQGAPASTWLWCARLELALAEAGDDPGPRLARARDDLDQVLALDPDQELATTLIAQVDAARRGLTSAR